MKLYQMNRNPLSLLVVAVLLMCLTSNCVEQKRPRYIIDTVNIPEGAGIVLNDTKNKDWERGNRTLLYPVSRDAMLKNPDTVRVLLKKAQIVADRFNLLDEQPQ